MRGAIVGRYIVVLTIGAFLLWAYGPAWRSGFSPEFPDSSSYLDVAGQGAFSPGFWFARRPPTYPLLIWVVGSSARTIVLVQLLIATASWAWLSSTAWQHLRHRAVATAAIVLLLGVAVETRWAFWHTAVLTESLSSSLAVAGIAAWWRWFDGADRFRLVVATTLTAAWMLLRDSNAMTFVAVAVPGLVLLLVLEHRRTGPRRRGMAVALAVLLVVAAFSVAGQVSSDRGETSFHNNVGLRWLVDDDMSAWMQSRGMPISDALRERAGRDAWADGEAFLRSPLLKDYRDWADRRGRVAAATSFVIRADWYLERLWGDLPGYTSTDHLAYDSFEIADRLPERPLGPVDPVGSRAAMTAWAVLVLVSGVVVGRRETRRGWLIPFLAVPVLSDLYLSYVADAVEVGRHLVGPMLRFEVVAIVSVAVGIDALVSDRTGGAHEVHRETVDVEA